MIHRKKINDDIHKKIIKLQKDHILLARDTEISIKKFIYEKCLYQKFTGKLFDKNTILLISRNKVKSTIYIDKDGIRSIFDKNNKLRENYSEIIINTNSVIIVNEYLEYKRRMKKTIDKKSYTEIFNDKLLTYSISNVTYRRNSNTIYTKEEMNCGNLKAIINKEIVYCIKKLCNKVK